MVVLGPSDIILLLQIVVVLCIISFCLGAYCIISFARLLSPYLRFLPDQLGTDLGNYITRSNLVNRGINPDLVIHDSSDSDSDIKLE